MKLELVGFSISLLTSVLLTVSVPEELISVEAVEVIDFASVETNVEVSTLVDATEVSTVEAVLMAGLEVEGPSDVVPDCSFEFRLVSELIPIIDEVVLLSEMRSGETPIELSGCGTEADLSVGIWVLVVSEVVKPETWDWSRVSLVDEAVISLSGFSDVIIVGVFTISELVVAVINAEELEPVKSG
jgi:hypothetical protein